MSFCDKTIPLDAESVEYLKSIRSLTPLERLETKTGYWRHVCAHLRPIQGSFLEEVDLVAQGDRYRDALTYQSCVN